MQKGIKQLIWGPINFCYLIKFGNLRVARVSQYQANKIGFKSFGHLEHQKQTSLDLKPSVANTLPFSGY